MIVELLTAPATENSVLQNLGIFHSALQRKLQSCSDSQLTAPNQESLPSLHHNCNIDDHQLEKASCQIGLYEPV